MSRRVSKRPALDALVSPVAVDVDALDLQSRVPYIGQKYRIDDDGTEYVWCTTNADLVAGELVATATCQAASIDGGCTAAAIGATSVTIDTTGVAMFGGAAGVIAQDRLAEGYLVIEDDAGEGYTYRIRKNTAGTAAASITLTLYDGLKVALTTASMCTLLVRAIVR